MTPNEHQNFDPKQVADGRRLMWAIVALFSFFLASGYGIHLYRNYQKIEAQLRQDEDLRAKPFDDEQTVSEMGEVFYVNHDVRLREGRLYLVWGIRVKTKRWSCQYEGGFSQWREGDIVRLIRHEDAGDESDYTAFLVGLRGGNIGAVSQVQAIDADELADDVDANQDQ